MPANKSRKKKEQRSTRFKSYAVAAILLVLSLLCFLSLISFTQRDLEGTTETYNLLGVGGAYLAVVLLKLFGAASFIFSASLLAFSLSAFFNRKLEVNPIQIAGEMLLVFASTALAQFALGSTLILDHNAGGVLGIFLSEVSVAISTPTHAIIAWIVVAGIGLLMLTQTHPLTLLKWLWVAIRSASTGTARLVSSVFRAQEAASPSLAFSAVGVNTSSHGSDVSSILAENQRMPQGLADEPTHHSHVELTADSDHEIPKAEGRLVSQTGKRKTIITRNGMKIEKANFVLARVKRKAKKSRTPSRSFSRKSVELPRQEPDFEFDSIVAPEEIVRTQVLGDWKPRTITAGAKESQSTPKHLSFSASQRNPTAATRVVGDIKLNLTPAEEFSDLSTPGAVEALRQKAIGAHVSQPRSWSTAPSQSVIAHKNRAPASPAAVSSTIAFAETITSEAEDAASLQQVVDAARPQSAKPRSIESIVVRAREQAARDEIIPAAPQPAAAEAVQHSRPSNDKIAVSSNKELDDVQAILEADSTTFTAIDVVAKKTVKEDVVVAQAKQRVSDAELEQSEKIRQAKLLQASEEQDFIHPPLSLLNYRSDDQVGYNAEQLKAKGILIEEKLADYKIKGKVVQICPGPVVTRFEFLPAAGTKVNTIAKRCDDLKMALEVISIRILAPIPGKGVVGIEIPNDERETVYIKEILGSDAFTKAKSVLTLALGKDIEGEAVVSDLADMPHLLVAGATGSGKSVAINTMLCSLLYNATPDEVRLILIDPKRLELSMYNGVPHLLLPPITEPPQAAQALNWACEEMERRYTRMEELNVRNIKGYNRKVKRGSDKIAAELARVDADGNPVHGFMPYIVIIIDELADLMMVAAKEVETHIARLAQKARACGIHLILATQRPSVDVLTGLIKANFPTRLAFRVFSGTDSKTILDKTGAEALLGKGDSLFLPPRTGLQQRVHGAFVSDDEVQRIVEFLSEQREPEYDESILFEGEDDGDIGSSASGEFDARYDEAVAIISALGKASTSMLQRKMNIGYARAGRIMDQLEEQGVVGPPNGSKPREVLIQPL